MATEGIVLLALLMVVLVLAWAIAPPEALRRRIHRHRSVVPLLVLIVAVAASMLAMIVSLQGPQFVLAEWAVLVFLATSWLILAALGLLVSWGQATNPSKRTPKTPPREPELPQPVPVPALSEAEAMPPVDVMPAATRDDGREWLRRRQDGYLTQVYLGLHVTIVSVALGIAGIAAAGLLTVDDMPWQFRLLSGLLWTASLLATVVAFAGTVGGSFALPARSPSMWDLFLPLLIGIAEFLLFAILTPQLTGDALDHNALSSWFFCLAVFASISTAAILRAQIIFRRTGSHHPAISSIAWYVDGLRNVAAGAITVGLLGAIGGALLLIFPSQTLWIASITGGLITAGLVHGLIGQGRTAHRWRELLKRG